MTPSRLAGAVAAAALLAAGAVGASAWQDVPREAAPAPDPIGDILRTTPAPVEPAPAADPAPAAPIVVTPPDPAAIAQVDAEAEKDQGDEEAAPQTKAAAKAEVPPTPGRRQRRPVAIVQAIDKITAESMRFEVEVGGRPVRFNKTLIFTARACEVSAPDELVEDAVAYLDVSIQPRGSIQSTEPRQVFRGWMFASSPAVSGLEHPIYDAWVVGCKG